MRVLLITPDYPPMRGGIQLICARLVAHSRHAFEVVCAGAAEGSLDDGTIRAIRAPRLPSPAASVAALNAAALGRALSPRPEAIISGHIVASPAAVVAQRLLGIPFVQYFYALELSARPRLMRFAASNAAAAVAVSSYTRQLAASLGAPAGSVRVIKPGVDLPPSAALPAERPIRSATIITVARLEDRYKGFDVMLKALPLVRAKVADVQWVVVGEGPLRAELQGTAEALGLGDCVTFKRAVDDATRDQLLEEADVFAMPSRLLPGGGGGEGFGIVYLEAGAHGLPCVAGNVGGALDAVSDGETGLLVDPTDHVAVAEAITRLLTDRELASRLGQAGRRRAQSQSWQAMAGQVDDLLEEVVRERRRLRH